MRLSNRLRALVIAALSVILVIGVVATLQINANGPTSAGRSRTLEQSTQPGLARTTAQPATVTPAPRPSATPTPMQPVRLILASVEQQPSQGGLLITLDVANQSVTPLAFQFAPEYDLQITDAAGHEWPLRWASYDGAPSVPAGKTTQLVRAFVAGDVGHARWPLSVTARHVPQAGQVSWRIDQHGTPSLASSPAPLTLPKLPTGGPVQLSLSNIQPSSQLGGVQADLMVHNNQSSDLVFRFDPASQVSAQDNLGHPYEVRWAQYGGIVHVSPHQTVRLARVFLAGPLDNGNPTWIKVSVRQVPGVKPLEAATGI